MNIRTTRFILATASVLVAAVIIGGLLLYEAPASNREALFLALGLVLALPGNAFAFYFGSSQGSADKTAIIDRNMKEGNEP